MKDNKITTTQLSLPKGGGAIQGIGETFQSNEFTGTAALSIPIPTTPCRGLEPQLSVEYSSGSGNGIFGLGFGLAIPNISRKTSKAIPKYDETDIFLLSNAEDLVPIPESTKTIDKYTVTAYRPRVEGLFAKIEHWINKLTKDCYWRTVSKDNVTSIFGKTDQARICDPDNPSRVFKWLLEETFDAKGNYVVYQYKSENTDNVSTKAIYEKNRNQTANKYIERIKYGNDRPVFGGQDTQSVTWHFEVVFDYGEYDIAPKNKTPYSSVDKWQNRQDSFSTYHAGFEIRTHRLCRNILLFHRFEAELGENPILVHATHFEYQETPTVTLLKKVETVGYRYEKGKYETKDLPPVEFDYTAFPPKKQNFEPLLQGQDRELPGLNLPPNYQSIDLYGEGIPGVLYSDGTTTLYWEPEGEGDGNRGAVKYAPPKKLSEFPIERHLQEANQTLMDLASDGRMALVVHASGASGYYQYDPDGETWQSFQPFAGYPTDFRNPDNQMVDVTGDGLMDILLVEGDRLRVYPSQGEKGFGMPLTPERENDVPMFKKGDLEEVLRFADIFGTGKQHLVRITNGVVECWPNLGYGRFGKKVQLANAPSFEERMDASRLFLVDIDGSGTADIAYVSSKYIQIWFNHSGNSFSEPQTVDLPSCWDNLNQINFADVLGNGTTGLVFSQNHPQPRHWYYDFCGKQKPYLLNQVNNNLGAISKITYASSTQFYLEDKRKGTPWVTKLPFPVQVVAKVESIDEISQTKLVSSYSYHHGYYDRIEREFRGFGRVERQDAETLSVDAESTDVSPILTKTWYHTGAWQQTASLFKQYEREYFPGDDRTAKMFEPKFDWGENEPSAEEVRQANMALKATVLRSEVYGLDGSELAKNPYSVSEGGYNIKLLQPLDENQPGEYKNAVFFVWERETLAYDYERNPQDPRVSHHFTVEIDEYGNVLRDCAIAYGRRQLTGEELPEQASLKVAYTENRLINRAEKNVWLLGVPVESKSFELKNLSLPQGQEYFDFEAIAQELDKANRNLLSWERHLYWDKSLQNSLPLGQVSPQELLARSEVAVVSKQQIELAFSEVLDEKKLNTLLKDQGKYELDSGYYWNPGLTQSYLGKNRFYLPSKTTDPFKNFSQVEYDRYHLLAVKVTDAIGNETVIEAIDYQTLSPEKIRDFNDNISEVRFDPLGMVILSSHYGTENGQPVGFAALSDRPVETFDMETAIANPQTYLQEAASYFYYDLDAWKNDSIPAHAVNLVAEDYPTDARVQTHIIYSDGFGRELQTKMRVEPGKAFVVESDGSVEEQKTSSRWLSSGGKVYNNKGNPVQEYEPYYIDTHEYLDHPTLNRFGVSSVLRHDPLQRVIKVDTPKGFFTKVEFTPWEQKHYDENDTVKDSPYYQENIDKLPSQPYGVHTSPDQLQNNESSPPSPPSLGGTRFQSPPELGDLGGKNLRDETQETDVDRVASQPGERQALENAAKFYDTPDIKILDNLGRTVRDVQQLEDGTQLVTYYELDIIGNQLSSTDPRLAEKGIKNFQTIYDLTQTALKTVSTDAGTHWTLHNVMGNPIYVKDSRNFEVTREYDALHRPVEVRVKGGDGVVALDNIVDRIVYGESVADAKERNLCGQVYQHYDSAGLGQIEAYSINGQPLNSQRQLREEYQEEVNWSDEKQDLLQETVYSTSTRYDAIGRAIAETDAGGNVHHPTYNLSGSLDQLEVTHAGETQPTIYVKSIDYNSKGQRTRIVYGNGVKTSYEYEPTTFHLTQILTKREDKRLQDLKYTYDPVGNITRIADNAWKSVFNNNQKVKPVSNYTYDALYCLVAATGREHPALSGQQERHSDVPEAGFVPLQNLNNFQAVENYVRRYIYDQGGNLYRIEHSGKNSRTRNLTVSKNSNRAVDSELLNKTKSQPTAPAKEIDKFFDANGNQITMRGIRQVKWNYHDNIASVTIIERENAASDGEYYVYDSSGSRVRKVTERYSKDGKVAHIDETIYLGGVEIRRTRRGKTVTEERHCLRVMDDTTCIAVRNHWTIGEPPQGVKKIQMRYQLDNHLGSATMEVDDEGQLISYEEYFPYGGTAFVAGRSLAEVKLKHYRYSGKERDASTGLYYYGARYYAPWLGRWMSCDPAGTIDGLNLYVFVRGNPVLFVDRQGTCSSSSKPYLTKRTYQSSQSSSANKTQKDRREYNNSNDSKNDRKARYYDRLARIYHLKNSVATAVTYMQDSKKFEIAVNDKQDIENNIQNINKLIKNFLRNKLDEDEAQSKKVAKNLIDWGNNTRKIGIKNNHSDNERLEQDLTKIHKIVNDNDDQSVFTKEQKNSLKNHGIRRHILSKKVSKMSNKKKEKEKFYNVHAESYLAYKVKKIQGVNKIQGVENIIGVNKLSCLSCHEFLQKEHQDIVYSGTHGYKFPGWVHPSSKNIEKFEFQEKVEADSQLPLKMSPSNSPEKR